MDTTPLLPAPTELHLSHLAIDSDGITVVASTRRAAVSCPRCATLARRVHSQYTRRFADLPWHGLAVEIVVTSRRFFCDLVGCSQRIFTERMPETAAPSARRTRRLSAALDLLGVALGGAAGARLAAALGMVVSGDTVRRIVLRGSSDSLTLDAVPRVLGVDDWAWRRGHTYGTVLVDLERRRVVDLLPDRTAETLAAWLRAHAGVEIIARDRSSTYADGARAGAPDAIQVADRFHLLRNLGEAVDRVVTRHHKAVREAAQACGARDPLPRDAVRRRRVSGLPHNAGGPAQAERRSAERRARRLARYNEVVALWGAHLSIAEIRRRTGLDRRTITTWLAAGHFPERRPRRPLPRSIDPYREVIDARYAAGVENASQVARELRGLGYTGSEAAVRRCFQMLRQKWARAPALESSPVAPHYTARQTSWLLRRPDAELTPQERAYLEELEARCPALAEVRIVALEFQAMLSTRNPNVLQPWLDRARSGELARFAIGIERDRDAVLAATIFPWTNGQVEGQVNRLKLIKRQGYGRTGFALLRQRVRRAA